MTASIATLLGRQRATRVGSLLAPGPAVGLLLTLMTALCSASPAGAGVLLPCGDFPACAGQACPAGFECTDTGTGCFCLPLPTPTATTTPTPRPESVPVTSNGGLGIGLVLLIAVSAIALAQRRRTS